MFNLTVTVDASGAMDLLRNLESEFADINGPMGDALTDCGSAYLEFVRIRFGQASQGDGTWAPLAPSTIAQKKQNKDLVLVEYGDLFASLIPGAENNILRTFAEGNILGVVAGTNDPKAPFHQYGSGRLPKREIIVPPDNLALMHMANAVRAGVASVLQGLSGNTRSGPALGLSAAA